MELWYPVRARARSDHAMLRQRPVPGRCMMHCRRLHVYCTVLTFLRAPLVSVASDTSIYFFFLPSAGCFPSSGKKGKREFVKKREPVTVSFEYRSKSILEIIKSPMRPRIESWYLKMIGPEESPTSVSFSLLILIIKLRFENLTQV